MRAILRTLGLAALVTTALARPTLADELVLGVDTILSGPGAYWGTSLKNAAEFLAEDWNSKGGLPVGGKTYQIKVVTYDDEFKPMQSVSVINRLIFEDGAKFIFGPMSAAQLAATMPILTENKVVNFTTAWSQLPMSLDCTYCFRPNMSPTEIAEARLEWIVAETSIKKVAILGPNDETGQQTGAKLQPTYEALGVETIYESYERDRIDFSSILARLLASGIDAIETNGSPGSVAGVIVKQARELGFTGPIIQTGGDVAADVIKIAGVEAAEGIYTNLEFDMADPKIKAIADRHMEKYNAAMGPYLPTFYAGGELLLAAIQKVGSIDDVEAITNAMRETEQLESSIGTISLDTSDNYEGKPQRQIITPFFIGQIRNGENVVVARCEGGVCQ